MKFHVCLLCFVCTVVSQENSVTQNDNNNYLDTKYVHDAESSVIIELQRDIFKIKNAVMGIAELTIDIKSDMSQIREELVNEQVEIPRPEFLHYDPDLELLRMERNRNLAKRIERLLSVKNNYQVKKVMDEIQRTIRLNFIRVLSAMLISGPPETRNRKEEILQLMKVTLNNELDFEPVIQQLPFILKDSETNQFINLLKVLREHESKTKFRQGDEDNDGDGEDGDGTTQGQVTRFPSSTLQRPVQEATPSNAHHQLLQLQQLQQLQIQQLQQQQLQQLVAAQLSQISQPGSAGTGQSGVAGGTGSGTAGVSQMNNPPTTRKPGGIIAVLDAVGKLDVNRIATFLTRLPEIFEGVETIVEGAEDYLNFGDIV